MGKRSTNTTKSGKFMNPTDQARKEARKRELKKNKKQRQMVRAAVLKGKNPREIIAELEKIDDMEFNVLSPPPLNDKVLRDKRRKLHETWQRVIHMYEKEDVEQYVELKKLWHSYQNRKQEVIQHFESVRNAQNVQVDDIPLPAMPEDEDESANSTDNIPLPPSIHLKPKTSILKKPSVLDSLKPKVCPGVPMVPPPSLDDYGVDDISDEERGEQEESKSASQRSRRIRFDDEPEAQREEKEKDDVVAPGEESGPQVDEIQRKMLQMAGQDIDQYMREMEEVKRQTKAERAADVKDRLSRIEEIPSQPTRTLGYTQPFVMTPNPNVAPPMMPLGRPPSIRYRPAPPPLRPGVAPSTVRLPPGPPPGRPPAPPPGLPPQPPPMMMVRGGGLPMRPPLVPGGVVSAGPQLTKEPSTTAASTSNLVGAGVIEAKPQMRNLKSDITRFVPTNVRVKRDNVGKKKQSDPLSDVFRHPSRPAPVQNAKDDAYAQFMQEMDQLLK